MDKTEEVKNILNRFLVADAFDPHRVYPSPTTIKFTREICQLFETETKPSILDITGKFPRNETGKSIIIKPSDDTGLLTEADIDFIIGWSQVHRNQMTGDLVRERLICAIKKASEAQRDLTRAECQKEKEEFVREAELNCPDLANRVFWQSLKAEFLEVKG